MKSRFRTDLSCETAEPKSARSGDHRSRLCQFPVAWSSQYTVRGRLAVRSQSVRENFQLSQAAASIFLTSSSEAFTSGVIGRIESMLGAKTSFAVATGAIAFDRVTVAEGRADTLHAP